MHAVTRDEVITLLVVAVGLWALVQLAGLKFWQMAVVFAAGFYLASTAAGAQVTDLIARLTAVFGH